ncbi:MAG: ATP-binding protein [Gammaproteobacteria bacterium]
MSAVASPGGLIGELAASIAHEVNQPLCAIVTSAECCLRWLDSEKPNLDMVRKAAQRIVRDGHHASDVIHSVRTMLGDSAPEFSCLNINEIIVDVLDLTRHELHRSGVQIDTHLEGDLHIAGYRTQIRQLLVNLIQNAIDAMSEGGPRRLRVKTSRESDVCLRIAISDSGCGLDPVTFKRLFEPFFTTKQTGTGLGLAICRAIVEAHAGRIWATAGARAGSTFHVELPTVVGQ